MFASLGLGWESVDWAKYRQIHSSIWTWTFFKKQKYSEQMSTQRILLCRQLVVSTRETFVPKSRNDFVNIWQVLWITTSLYWLPGWAHRLATFGFVSLCIPVFLHRFGYFTYHLILCQKSSTRKEKKTTLCNDEHQVVVTDASASTAAPRF